MDARKTRRGRPVWPAAVGVLLATACSGDAPEASEDAAVEPSNETLASLVAGDKELSTVAATLADAGLAYVFDGAAAYTLLAPRDAVFDELGAVGEALRSAEQRPAMVAVLRDHIVPGYLVPEDIARAIALEDDGKVEMKTMGGHTLTFTSDGGTITATGPGGATARFAGEALRASNGVAIPVDGLTVDLGPADPQ